MLRKKWSMVFMTCALVASLGLPATARAVVTLPDPTVYAISTDMFYSYSAQILTHLGFQGFDYSTGSGTQDLAIFTFNNALNNKNIAAGFPIPFQIPNNPGPTWSGSWGTGGTITVDHLKAYLNTTFGPNINIPVFVFDFNNIGPFDITGQARIYSNPADPTGSLVQQFSLDAINTVIPATATLPRDFIYEPNAFVAVQPTVQFPYNTGTTIGPIPSSNGSGKADFLAYSPAMDLGLYSGKGLFIDFSFNTAGNDDGAEELFLSGAFATPSEVPEPTTMLLMGAGMLGAAFAKRRKAKKA